MSVSVRSRVPVSRVKTIVRQPAFTLDAFLDRATTPREPEKPNDLFVLAVFGCTCVAALVPSLALMARHFGY